MKQIIIDETDKMIEAFMKDFFIPYLDYLKEFESQEDIANIIISFSQSCFLTTIHPILNSLPTEKQKLRHIREIIEIVSNNLYKTSGVNFNKKKLN